MSFVDNDNTVFAEGRIGHEFTDNHSIGQIFYSSVRGVLLIETDSISDKFADRSILFSCDTKRERGGGYSTRLGDSDDAVPGETTFEYRLRYL
jgi:hypothetical protein